MKTKPEQLRKHVRVKRPFLAKPRELEVELKVRNQYFTTFRSTSRQECLWHARMLRLALANLINERAGQ